MKFLLIFILTLSALYANKSITKSATINSMLYPNKTYDQLKSIVLRKAELAAAKEIFGEFLLTETVMFNGKILKDIIKEKSGGVIHIKGEPLYENGKNLGEIKVTINAYVTESDIQDVSPHVITLNNFKYNNPNISIRKLKRAAEDAFIMKAISIKKPSIVNSTPAEARKLALSINIRKFKFDDSTFSYTISGDVKYIPAFLRHADLISNKTLDDKLKEIKDDNYVAQVDKIKRGFYGKWSGFIMSHDGGNFSVTINIQNNGESSIDYDSLKCGGDLVIESKTDKIVEFKEVLTYGDSYCTNHKLIKLKISGDRKILFKTFTQDKKELSSGTLYRKSTSI